ncbi:MAG TPA: response regulator [Chlamydiales bacterium]|nr:response regulator [Chlamydiales bacterium]
MQEVENPERSRRIIIIDDDPTFVSMLTSMLESLGFEVKASTDARSSQTYEIRDSDIVFVDAVMPHVSGLQVLEQLARQGTKALIIAMSGDPQRLDQAESLARKLELNIVGVLEKPFRVTDLKFILDDL